MENLNKSRKSLSYSLLNHHL